MKNALIEALIIVVVGLGSVAIGYLLYWAIRLVIFFSTGIGWE